MFPSARRGYGVGTEKGTLGLGFFGGPPDIEKLRAKADLHRALRAVSYTKSDLVRAQAMNASIEIALESEDDEDIRVVISEIATRAIHGDGYAVEALVKTVQRAFTRDGSASSVLQDEAKKALAAVGGPAVGPMIASLGHPDPLVRRDAVWVLRNSQELWARSW